ncbi:response regulator [Lacihabitans soyangensis]|uniref:Sensory/regulatory protein RpfC n=1 Tax=Lacihabitans soyangensis TaxID=869394 RepID=A0AAE3H5Z2_9BACT|nr:response regulator [Lacihabitans soyangensis]
MKRQKKKPNRRNRINYYDLTIVSNTTDIYQKVKINKYTFSVIISSNNKLKKEENKHDNELDIAKKELVLQNIEKEKRAQELVVANKELAFQNLEKSKREEELALANIELAFQTHEKGKRAEELVLANKELVFQNLEKEKRAAELTKANLARILIEASHDPLFTINPSGKITDLNNASAKITGMSRENLLGTDFFEHFTEPQKAREVYKEVFDKGFVSDYPLTIRDHKLTEVLFNGSVFKDEAGIVVGVVVVAREITEQKRIENELIEAKVFAELATEIAEETQKRSENAMHIAENAVKSKQQFLSNMSHEIRTPMNAIIGFTKVVLKTELTAKQREYLSAIKISGDALIVLINDILDLAKVDAGKMTFEEIPFKMAASIKAMLHLFETKIQEKNLELEVDYDENIPEVLVGDSVRLNQIILNLVSNAVKFTSTGKITVKVEMLSENTEEVNIKFEISDTGIGVSKDKIKHIFDNFQQATSGTSRLYGGTGLGLAIVKQLVEKQGGNIEVDSQLDIGSSFSFQLVFKKTIQQETNRKASQDLEDEMVGIKVLVVEDMELNQLLMKTLLEDFKFECDIVTNGKLAVQRLTEKSYDIILMDLQMPEMNGFDATKYIRNILKLQVPIMALTADVTTVDLEKCKAVGMNDYIAKPVDEKLLYSKIIELVKRTISLDDKLKTEELIVKVRCINLSYLLEKTKSNPKLMAEMIKLYLEQTPPLIAAMKLGFQTSDWKLLNSAVHKMIPSFSIMGMDNNFEDMAKKIQEYAIQQEISNHISDLVMKLEHICLQACEELEEELNKLKNTSNE